MFGLWDAMASLNAWAADSQLWNAMDSWKSWGAWTCSQGGAGATNAMDSWNSLNAGGAWTHPAKCWSWRSKCMTRCCSKNAECSMS